MIKTSGEIDADDQEHSKRTTLIDNGDYDNPTDPNLRKVTLTQPQMRYDYSQQWKPSEGASTALDYTFNLLTIKLNTERISGLRFVVDGESPILIPDAYATTGTEMRRGVAGNYLWLNVALNIDELATTGTDTATMTITATAPGQYEPLQLEITFTGLTGKQAIHWEG